MLGSGQVNRRASEHYVYGSQPPALTLHAPIRYLDSNGISSWSSTADQVFFRPQVAVKRIANVLSSPEQAKRVLREICILRRLTHPFIIELKDAFVRPSATG